MKKAKFSLGAAHYTRKQEKRSRPTKMDSSMSPGLSRLWLTEAQLLSRLTAETSIQLRWQKMVFCTVGVEAAKATTKVSAD